MNQQEREQIREALSPFFKESLERVLLSNPTDPQKLSKAKIRPLLLKGSLVFQAEEQSGKQALHRNMSADEAVEYMISLLENAFRQAQVESLQGTALVLISKKGRVTVKTKRRPDGLQTMCAPARLMEHNRRKRYILEEGKPVPFLVDLGVMTREGKIINSRYDKYRQINRFLEFIEDILPHLDQERETTIIDFGCGKSYLTFAMYYYLNVLKNYPVRIIGLDLKQDVIDRCNELRTQYGYEKLDFYYGDIASYEGVDHVDMVVTLHACDTATDYAMEKAVLWGAGVILSVPCCQHELNRQISCGLLDPVMQYGLLKERMAALYTDGIRAQVLEYRGYKTQILEFIDMEHTPKNILIRAVKQEQEKNKKDQGQALRKLLDFLKAKPMIVELLAPELLP